MAGRHRLKYPEPAVSRSSVISAVGQMSPIYCRYISGDWARTKLYFLVTEALAPVFIWQWTRWELNQQPHDHASDMLLIEQPNHKTCTVSGHN